MGIPHIAGLLGRRVFVISPGLLLIGLLLKVAILSKKTLKNPKHSGKFKKKIKKQITKKNNPTIQKETQNLKNTLILKIIQETTKK